MEPETKPPDIEKPLMGEILLARKKITNDQLKEALSRQKAEKGYLGEILVKLGYIDERDIVVALIMQYNFPYIAINKYEIDKELLKFVPEKLARECHVVPLDRVGDVLSVVMADPLDQKLKDNLAGTSRCKIAPFIATKQEIVAAIDRFYRTP